MILIVVLFCPLANGKVIYVDDDAAGTNNGSSWIDAYKCLQNALTDAQSGDEIWVAQGIYKPDQTFVTGWRGGPQVIASGEREATFQMKDGVTIMGGYAGFGDSDPNARDLEMYEAILSGDLAENDIEVADPCDLLTEPTRSENSYHVVKGNETDETAVLDGFTITCGNADGQSPNDQGGGLHTRFGSPTLIDCTFSCNSAGAHGGGMNSSDSNPTLINCTFTANSAYKSGGGIMNVINSNPTLINCRFTANSAFDKGGGMFNRVNSNPMLINCIFNGNWAYAQGGGMMINNDSRPTLINCILTGNSAGAGGGGLGIQVKSAPTLINCTFTRNSADKNGAEIFIRTSQMTLINCIVWSEWPDDLSIENSTAQITYSLIRGGWPGEGNIHNDPLFADPVNGDYHLKSKTGRWDSNSQSWVQDNVNSPCIDKGDPNSDWTLEPWPNGERINMGAYGGTAQASMSPSDVNDLPDPGTDDVNEPNIEPTIINNPGPVIIDGPWISLPPWANSGFAFDDDWKALTLSSDMTDMVFVLEPEPDKDAFANHIWDIGSYDGRVYIGYGDQMHNQGPVDIVSYDPLSDTLVSEMLHVPEEAVGYWHTSTDGRKICVSGLDTKESSTFGSFYINDGLGWQKRRTIYNGVHVREVIGFKDHLYTLNNLGDGAGINYPHVTASFNNGATWYREKIDQNEPQFVCADFDYDTVTHRVKVGGIIKEIPYLYTTSFLNPIGSNNKSSGYFRLYRFDDKNWEQVDFPNSMGKFRPANLISRQDLMFVEGTFRYTNGTSEDRVYALDGQTQMEVEFLRGKEVLSKGKESWGIYIYDGWYHFIEDLQFDDMDPGYVLYRSQDLQTWESVGAVPFMPGVDIVSYRIAHNRLYIGVTNTLRQYIENYIQISKSRNSELSNATLHWDADVPEGAQLSFQFSAESGSNALFIGPDGTEETFFTISGEALPPQFNGQYIRQERIRIYKTPNSQGELPHVRWLTLDTGTDCVVSMAVDEGQGLYTAASSTDPNGTEYLSQKYELQEPIHGGCLFFEGATPGQTSLRFQLRSALTDNQLEQKSFVGPDGTVNTYYENSGQDLWAGHDGDLCIQYKAVLTSLEPTLAPFLRKVVLVTQSNKLDHFNSQLDDSIPWIAGETYPITVTAKSADDMLIPIDGKISLSAVDTLSSGSLQIEPTELMLSDGIGTLNVSLKKATLTQICLELADVTGQSSVIDVQPGEAFSIEMTTDLAAPSPHESPVGNVGQPFTLSLRILDRYHNTVTGYAGTVRCERWSWKSEAELLSPYTFQPSDQGYHQFLNAVQIEESSGWNVVCLDEIKPQIAGSLTVCIR